MNIYPFRPFDRFMCGFSAQIRVIAFGGLLSAAALALAGCGGGATEAPPLAGARIGGPFQLKAANGQAVDQSMLKDHYSIVYFGYTSCPDICPTDMANLAQGLRRFAAEDPARARRVQIIFISVDPGRDTPKVVGEFVHAFGPNVIGLTGTPAQVTAAAQVYGVPFTIHPPVGKAPGYLVDHGRMAPLMGPDGQPIILVPEDEDAEAVAKTLSRWVA